VEERGGQGPLASTPRCEVSPNPSCPSLFLPQHLTVASSCGEKQPRVTDWLRGDEFGESFTERRQAHRFWVVWD
jgi:hypothetical protein